MENVLRLIREKDTVENKIHSLSEILEKNENVGMREPLVDSEGYPRADIDVYQVRHARHNIIYLQNDHKAIMKKIEKSLQDLHQNVSTADPNGTNILVSLEDLTAFAIINRVDMGSPSETDGLQVNDEICKFGSITSDNFHELSVIGELVQHSKNKQIQVVVRRNNKEKIVILTPRNWVGRGLLGCNIVPLDTVDR